MSSITASAVRSLVLEKVAGSLAGSGVQLQDIPDDFDLLNEGVIDSQGLVELIAAIEQHFNIQLDFDDLDPEHLTVIGPFCRYIEKKCSTNGSAKIYAKQHANGN